MTGHGAMTSQLTSQLSIKFAIKKDTCDSENFVSIGLTVPEKMIFKAKEPENCRRKKKNNKQKKNNRLPSPFDWVP